MSSKTQRQPFYPRLSAQYLAAEQALLARTYPQFRLARRGEMLVFQGPLRSNYGSIFVLEVRLPPLYPEQEPHLWVLSPTLPARTEHRYVDGRICAHADPFVAYRTTVATMVSVMAGWIFRFERHRLEGVSWEAPIGVEGRPFAVNPDGTLYLGGR